MKYFKVNYLSVTISALYLSLILLSSSAYCQISVITQRLREDLISKNIDDSEVKSYLNTLNADGSWNDIDYTNTSITNWPAVNHSGRLETICAAYNKPSSSFFHRSDVKVKIEGIINYYIKTKPYSANWWYNAIGAPINFGPALVLMKTGDSFGFDQMKLNMMADSLLNYFSESAKKWKFATTGANKIWLLRSSIDKACIKNNDTVLISNFKNAFEEAKIMAGKAEGIKSDFSFYQHGAQLYSGGYGMSFMNDITSFGLLTNGTTYQMTEIQLQTLSDAVLEGFQWFCQRSAFDFGACGREISRSGAVSSSSLKTIITRLKVMNPSKSAELTDSYNFLNGTAGFSHPGNKHFWKSDIMVQHGSYFYLSAKVPSKRTIATERMNNENLKWKWLPWGATNIMIDGDEYRNLFAVWDWSRIPGVTSYYEDSTGIASAKGSYLISPNEFAGGVSDGIYGLAADNYSWDGIEGRKAYFFTPEAMYCFGAGIKSSLDNPVITSVNQCISKGQVTIEKNGATSAFAQKEIAFRDLKWIYHDRVGYYFPSGGDITLKNTDQTGSWKEINSSQSDVPVTHKIFSSWISHGTAPSDGKYEYIVVPCKNLAGFRTWTTLNSLKMVVNRPDVQAVNDRNAGVYGIVLYNPASLTLEPGLVISTDKPCLLLIKTINKGKSYMISVSDPTATLSDVKISISKKLTGPGSVINLDNTTSISVSFPSGDDAGRTITREYFTQ